MPRTTQSLSQQLACQSLWTKCVDWFKLVIRQSALTDWFKLVIRQSALTGISGNMKLYSELFFIIRIK